MPGTPRLVRETFRTSRGLEFCSQRELVAQIGHDVQDWPLVILKELVDNAIDIAEEIGIAPRVAIEVSTERGEIVITDNGPGIPTETVDDLQDYTVRVSSREAYVSPTRGAQGNALSTIIAMPFALDGSAGETLIEAGGVKHCIRFTADPIRQEPRVTCDRGPSSVRNGTRVTVRSRVLARHPQHERREPPGRACRSRDNTLIVAYLAHHSGVSADDVPKPYGPTSVCATAPRRCRTGSWPRYPLCRFRLSLIAPPLPPVIRITVGELTRVAARLWALHGSCTR
jgi:hypothetical protein